jgi:hypothetical protein
MRKLSYWQDTVLRLMIEHGDQWCEHVHLTSRSQHGGFSAVIPSLVRRGLVARERVGHCDLVPRITDAGRMAVRS